MYLIQSLLFYTRRFGPIFAANKGGFHAADPTQ